MTERERDGRHGSKVPRYVFSYVGRTCPYYHKLLPLPSKVLLLSLSFPVFFLSRCIVSFRLTHLWRGVLFMMYCFIMSDTSPGGARPLFCVLLLRSIIFVVSSLFVSLCQRIWIACVLPDRKFNSWEVLPSAIFWTSRGHRCRPFSPPVRAFIFYRA